MIPVRRLTVAILSTALGLALMTMPASAAAGNGNNRQANIIAFSFGYRGTPIGTMNPAVMTLRFRDISKDDEHEMIYAKLAPTHAGDTLGTLIGELDNAFTTGDLSLIDTTVPPIAPMFPPGIVGGVFTGPGTATSGFVDLTRNGTYIFLCGVTEVINGVPVPHYHLGMLGKFQVASD